MQLFNYGVWTFSVVLATSLCGCPASRAHTLFKDILKQWQDGSSERERRTDDKQFPSLSNIHIAAETLESFFFRLPPRCSSQNKEGTDVPFSLTAYINAELAQRSGDIRLNISSSDNPSDQDYLGRNKLYQRPVAEANWTDAINATGWSHLTVKTKSDPLLNDFVTAYAAGVLEGILTSCRISQFFSNTQELLRRTPKEFSTRQSVRNTISHFIENALSGLGDYIQVFERLNLTRPKPAGTVFKMHVANVLLQVWGITDGYGYTKKYFASHGTASGWPDIDVIDMILLSEDGDYAELSDATLNCKGCNTSDNKKPELSGAMVTQARRHLGKKISSTALRDSREMTLPQLGRCSALVRLTANESNLLVGHATWEPYSEMTRVLKYYIFPFEGVAAPMLAMTSYPGAVTSTDDFMLTSQGLVITETTIDIPNRTIVNGNHLEQGKVPDFMAALIAGRLAHSAKEWARFYTEHRTLCQGVSSSQWMVIDYNRWKKSGHDTRFELPVTRQSKPPKTEILYVVESVPGLTLFEDKTNFLYEHGFWGSVNSASFPAIKNHIKSDTTGNARSFTLEQLAPKVNTVVEMMSIMQFSSTRGEQTGGLPSKYFIAPRFDLNTPAAFPQGATDAKVISAELVDRLQFWAISGPEHQQSAPFDWDEVDKGRKKRFGSSWPHLGMPQMWNFTWQLVTSSGARSCKACLSPADGSIKESSKGDRESLLESGERVAGWENLLIRALSRRGRKSKFVDIETKLVSPP